MTLISNLVASGKWSRIIDYIKRIRGISVCGVEVKIKVSPKRTLQLFSNLLETLNEWGEHYGKRAIIVFDEAQYLRFSRINFRSLIAYVYDNLTNITLILTGSEVGLLHDFLRIDDPSSELYGRYMYEVVLKRFSREKSIDFLIKGFKEYDIEPPRDVIEEAVSRLNGIVGWLVFFGRICLDKGVSREAIDEAFSKGVRLVMEELSELYRRSPRYRYVLEAIAYGHDTWSKIKRYLTARELKPIPDLTLHEILQVLQKMTIIEKVYKEGELRYKIIDPVIEYAIKYARTS